MKSKTNLFYFSYKIKRHETAKRPKRTERSINVQWTFIANGPAYARCLYATVKYLLEFKKNKINLDFCLAQTLLFIGVRESPKVDFYSLMK
jgi:hypothetical protein